MNIRFTNAHMQIDFIAQYIGFSVTKDGQLKAQLLCWSSNLTSMAPVPCSAPTIEVGHIDDVQELAKMRPTSVDATERPVLATIPTSMNITIIDMSKLAHGNEDESWGEMVKLDAACQEWGFFQVVNHGISTRLLESEQKVGKEFFMLPSEEKEKYPMAPGYIPLLQTSPKPFNLRGPLLRFAETVLELLLLGGGERGEAFSDRTALRLNRGGFKV